MRSIKFRAWDKKNKKFLKPYREQHIGNWVNKLSINMDGSLSFHEDDGFGGKSIGGESVEKRFELMQYTGLKDVNGVEIYEGDIVKQLPKEGYEHIIANGDLGIIKSSFGSCTIINAKDGRTHFFFYTEQEIIGNVYENSELLEDEVMREIK